MTTTKTPRSRERGPDRQPRKPRSAAGVANGPAYQRARAAREREEARFRKIRADRAALELAQLRGELISVEEVTQRSIRRIIVLRNALLQLPRQICPKLEGLEVRAMMGVMQERIEALLHEFADQDPC